MDGLNDLGLDAQPMPLMAIGPVVDVYPVHTAWLQLAQHHANFHAVMFVSANAVRYFFQANPLPHAPWPQVRAWVTGPGSRNVLQGCGVPQDCIDAPAMNGAQFDSEALWRVVQAQVVPGKRVLIVRGSAEDESHAMPSAPGTGRDWLARRILAAGGTPDFVVAYERRAPVWNDAELEWIAQAAGDGSVWILSSAEGLGYLLAAAPQQRWTHARAVATHPRIAAAARQAGFGQVHEARPVLAEIVASIESHA
jgi:uroporphyrinogen-III synthase